MLALRCSTPIYGGYNGGGGGYLSCCPCDVVRLYTGVITGEGGGYLSCWPCDVVRLYTGVITGEGGFTCPVGLAM